MIDISINDFINKGKPVSPVDFPMTSTLLQSFVEAVNVKDERRELESKSKKDRNTFKHFEIDKVSCCLTILSNINEPTKDIVKALYGVYLEEDEPLDTLIDKINNYRNYLKSINVFDKSKTKDDLCFSYIRACANFNNNGAIVSFDNKVIAFYKDVISYWHSGNWNAIYTKYKKASSMPNNVRFIARFCKIKGYSRATAQRYLITYNSKDCFTANDLQTITGGQCNLLDVLDKIGFLTKK